MNYPATKVFISSVINLIHPCDFPEKNVLHDLFARAFWASGEIMITRFPVVNNWPLECLRTKGQ